MPKMPVIASEQLTPTIQRGVARQATHAVARFFLRRIMGLIAPAIASVVCTGCGDEDVKKAELNETKVTVNELQSRNSTIESDTGKKSDWVELFNPAGTDENLSGYFASDDLSNLTKAVLGVGAVVPAGGYLVLWLDDTSDANTPLHLPFKLSGDGDYFFLTDPSGRTVQKITLPPDPTGADTNAPDVSYGAYPDGTDAFNWCQTPTPGRPNAADCVPPTNAAP